MSSRASGIRAVQRLQDARTDALAHASTTARARAHANQAPRSIAITPPPGSRWLLRGFPPAVNGSVGRVLLLVTRRPSIETRNRTGAAIAVQKIDGAGATHRCVDDSTRRRRARAEAPARRAPALIELAR